MDEKLLLIDELIKCYLAMESTAGEDSVNIVEITLEHYTTTIEKITSLRKLTPILKKFYNV